MVNPLAVWKEPKHAGWCRVFAGNDTLCTCMSADDKLAVQITRANKAEADAKAAREAYAKDIETLLASRKEARVLATHEMERNNPLRLVLQQIADDEHHDDHDPGDACGCAQRIARATLEGRKT